MSRRLPISSWRVSSWRVSSWRNGQDQRRWLSALVDAMEDAAEPDRRAAPCDSRTLADLRSRWLARSLFALAEIEQEGGRIASAVRAYESVLRHRLPFEAIARARIANLQGGG